MRRQQGVILLVTIFFLIVFGLAAVAATQTTVLSERIAGNQWEQDRAYQAAEAALIDGASWLLKEDESSLDSPLGEPDGGANYIYDIEQDLDACSTTTSAKFGEQSGSSVSLVASEVPLYAMQNIGWVRDSADPNSSMTLYYSVNACGFGQGDSDAARSRLQTNISKRFEMPQ